MPQDMTHIDVLDTEMVPGGSGFESHIALSALEAEGADMPVAARFADLLLAALVGMAVNSKRRQADLCAAMSRAGLRAEQAQMKVALDELAANGLIENIVPLYDGGVLLSVTSRGIEKRSAGPRWAMLGAADLARA